jgi:hypothetical protein
MNNAALIVFLGNCFMFALLTNSSKRLPRIVCINIEAKADGGGGGGGGMMVVVATAVFAVALANYSLPRVRVLCRTFDHKQTRK